MYLSPKEEGVKLKKISILIAVLCAGNLLNSFVSSTKASYLLSILAMILLLICIVNTKSSTKYMGVTLVSLGLLFNFIDPETTIYHFEGLLKNLSLLTLILFVPLISIPLRRSGLLDSPYFFINLWKYKERQTFFSITAFLALLSPILNLGSVRIMNDIIEDIQLHPKLQANASFVGFASAMVWSPYFGSIALVLFYTGLPISDYILIGLSYALLILLVGNVLYRRQGLYPQMVQTQENKILINDMPIHKRNIIILTLILAALIALLLLLEKITGESMILLVTVIAILFPLLYGSLMKKLKLILVDMYLYTKRVPVQLNREIVLFLSAGYFGDALLGSDVSKGLQKIIITISDHSFLLIILFITSMIAILSLVGVHQIISVPIIAIQISPDMIGTTPPIMALILIMAWSVSSIISPFAAINMIISQAAKTDSFTVGLKWNGLFAFLTFLIGLAIIFSLKLAS